MDNDNNQHHLFPNSFDHIIPEHDDSSQRTGIISNGQRSENIGTIVAGVQTPEDDTTAQRHNDDSIIKALQADKFSIVKQGAAKAMFNTVLLDNAVVRMILPYDPNRRVARLWAVSTVGAAILGPSTSLSNIVGSTWATGSPLINCVVIFAKAAGMQHFVFDYTGASELYGISNAPANVFQMCIINETYSEKPQIG